MKPYYSEAGIEIYHGDCRDVLPSLPKVDLVLTDPPYGINLGAGGGIYKGRHIYGDEVVLDPSFLLPNRAVIFGAEYFIAMLPKGKLILWDKRVDPRADRALGSPFELAWTNALSANKIYRIQHGGFVNSDGGLRCHPTQKPLRLFRSIIYDVGMPGLTLDPFMGSGTTLRAAKDLGRKAIGIEIEEKYCEIAANRLRQEVLKFEAVA